MATLAAPLQIDGSHGEGGGALLRAALAMSAMMQQPVRISGIRSATKFPGLNAEDLTVLRMLGACCEAVIEGASPRSSEVAFAPSRPARGMTGPIEIQDGEAGPGSGFANSLVLLNAALPVLGRTGAYSVLRAEGETHGHQILSYDYFANVTLAAYRAMGLYAYPDLAEAGYGRGSRGQVSLEVEPSVLEGAEWPSRGELRSCRAIVTTSQIALSVAERGVEHLERLAYNAGIKLDTETHQVPSDGRGAYATVYAEFERGFGGAGAMGAKGIRMEVVAQQAFEAFFEWYGSDATVDAHLADQILLAAAFAESGASFKVDRLTQRFLTIAWVIKQFVPIRLTVRGQEGEPGVVTIKR